LLSERLAVMIADHVPAVRLPPDNAGHREHDRHSAVNVLL
jgi:hypothetical protein